MSKIQDTYNLFLEAMEQENTIEDSEANQVANLRSNTQVCEEQGYDFRAGKDMPQSYQCGGIEHAGKYMRVDFDGYVRPYPAPGGEGYGPDFITIGLNSNGELAVVDYISSTMVNELLENKQDKLIAGENITITGNVISATGGGGYEPDN